MSVIIIYNRYEYLMDNKENISKSMVDLHKK